MMWYYELPNSIGGWSRIKSNKPPEIRKGLPQDRQARNVYQIPKAMEDYSLDQLRDHFTSPSRADSAGNIIFAGANPMMVSPEGRITYLDPTDPVHRVIVDWARSSPDHAD